MSSTKKRQCVDCGCELPDDNATSTCARCLLEACFFEESVYAAPEAAVELAPTLAAAGEIFGDYELQEEIARGGMGVVFKARQRSLDRMVALKMMLPGWWSNQETVRRFRREAEAASRLRHPGIVSIHEVGEAHGQQFYSMDLINGRDLARRIDEGPVSPELAARWVESIARAIHHAHQHGILHRDLKPANVLIDTTEQPHVTDFGLAKILDAARDLTATGHVLGTPGFMPPEQADPDRGGVTVASDVYGLGAILYFLFTGDAPFQGQSVEQILTRLLTEEPVPPSQRRPSLPRDLETICLKCLSKEPQRRYASAADLAEDLAAWARHEPIRARPVPLAERAWFWARRNPGLAAVSVGLVVAVVAGAILQQLALNETRHARNAAEGLLDYMTQDLTEQLRPLGRLRLLENINQTVQRYYQGLPMKENPSDPVTGKARFFVNNASVLRELGRLDQAQESARSAIALLQPLAQQQPSKPEWPTALAEAHAELRNILELSDAATALGHAQQAVQASSQACALEPANLPAKVRLANARLELASVLHERKRTAEAAQEIRSAVDLLSQLPDIGAHAADKQVQLALSYYYQGLVQFERGDKPSARQSFAEYLNRTQAAADVQNNPADARVLRNLAIAHSHLGRALLDNGEAAEALEHFREYQRLAENLERVDPGNVNYQKELGFSLAWLAEGLEKTGGTPSEINDLLQRSFRLFQKLAGQFPQGDFWQDQAALATTRLAVWLAQHNHSDQARQLLAQELTSRWNALVQFSDHRACHSRFLRALAWSEEQASTSDGSASTRLTRLQHWIEQAAAQATKPGAPGDWDWTLGSLRTQLANLLALQNQFEKAKRELELALPSWQRLAKQHAKDAEAAVAVVRTLCGISIAYLRSGAPDKAIGALRPLLDWLKTSPPTPATASQIVERLVALQSKLKAPSGEHAAEQSALLRELDATLDRLKATPPIQQAPQQ